jgi:GNAT superfamily N-acetyltransferase
MIMRKNVRIADLSDMDALGNIAEKSPFQEADAEGMASIEDHVRRGRMLVAVAGGMPVGMLMYRPHLWDGRPPFVEHLDVLPEAQGAGLGRALMAGIERVATDLGFSAIYSSTEETNIGSRKFHEGLGFVLDCAYPLREQAPLEYMYSKPVVPPIPIPADVDFLL